VELQQKKKTKPKNNHKTPIEGTQEIKTITKNISRSVNPNTE
jgi:hypothetical protein